MPSHKARVEYRWINPVTGQVHCASNCTLYTQSRSESGVIEQLKKSNPNLRPYNVIIDSLEWR
jgi:hypothetical protein